MTATLGALLRRQPLSPAKVRFAWRAAVGEAIDRATSVELTGGTLTVRTQDARWQREVQRSSHVILDRLEVLLGRDAVRRMVVS